MSVGNEMAGKKRCATAALLMGVAIVALAPAALANHGKAGLWSDTITVGGDAPAMPDMSKLPPEALARMKAMGMSMNGNTITSQHCMTPQEVATDAPHLDANNARGCTMSNVKHAGQSISADMTCSGNFKGTGHMEFLYDSDSHYSGELIMTGSVNGRPMKRDQKFEGHWVSADCSTLGH
jgi:Protein of unknown function (DUF3617)